jgi:hypothetical protein
MREHPINQATGLMGLGSGAGSQLIAVVSHGDEKAELPLLWQLCGALVELGYPVTVLDATKQETGENPGLSQLLDYRFGQGGTDSDALEWNVVPSALGIHDLCLMQSDQHDSLQRLGPLFQANSVVILYANADWLVHLLSDSQNQPLLAVSSGKNALLTSYLALKRLLVNGRLTPTILNMMQNGRTQAMGNNPTAAAHLSECARNFLGYQVNAMQINPSAPEADLKIHIRHLATRLLETASKLWPDYTQSLSAMSSFAHPTFAGRQ